MNDSRMAPSVEIIPHASVHRGFMSGVNRHPYSVNVWLYSFVGPSSGSSVAALDFWSVEVKHVVGRAFPAFPPHRSG